VVRRGLERSAVGRASDRGVQPRASAPQPFDLRGTPEPPQFAARSSGAARLKKAALPAVLDNQK
jgi:hypothetical protein